MLVAPSDVHCRVVANHLIQTAPGPPVNYVCPSIDVTMQSLGSPLSGSKLIGVILTGMGRDSAAGLAHIKRLGGLTVVQNAQTCAVYGMPAKPSNSAAWISNCRPKRSPNSWCVKSAPCPPASDLGRLPPPVGISSEHGSH